MNFRDVVSSAAWQDLLDRGTPRQYGRGAVLLRQGESAASVIALVDGIVKVLRTDVDGTTLTMMLRGPGEVLGEMGALLDRPRSVTIVAVTRCAVRTLSATDFRGYLNRRKLEHRAYELAVDRIEHAERLMSQLLTMGPIHRMACLITRFADEVGERTDEGVIVRLGMSREELGAATRMSRTLAVTVLQELQRKQLIRAGRGLVVVTEPAGLRELVTRANAGKHHE